MASSAAAAFLSVFPAASVEPGGAIAFVRDDALARDEIVCGRKITLKGSDSDGNCKRNQFALVRRMTSRQWSSTTASNTVGRNLFWKKWQYKGESLHDGSQVHGQARRRPVPAYRWSGSTSDGAAEARALGASCRAVTSSLFARLKSFS
jgi:hypothetical protein